ncbi:MAG: HAD family phosphatase [Clostridiales bacterium]|nr:HAD family phosphatase [Clostridiales bacterium]
MIKNIVFDMGGVIIDFDPEKTLKKYFGDKNDVELIKDVLFVKNVWGPMDQGLMTVEEVAKEACGYLPKRLHEPLTKLLFRWWDEMPPFPEMCEFIRFLKEDMGFKIFLLSNTPPEFHKRKSQIPAFKYFDGFIASCDYKCVKPDPEIFIILFSTFGLLPEECYFIDDMKRNTDAASKLGMKTHCYSHGNVNVLREAMRDEGIIN